MNTLSEENKGTSHKNQDSTSNRTMSIVSEEYKGTRTERKEWDSNSNNNVNVITEENECNAREDWESNPSTRITTEEEKGTERQVWEFMTPLAWHNSISEKNSIFLETYDATRSQVIDTATKGNYDVIIEVGCGTGDIIGQISTVIPRYGLDINEEFIQFCCEQHSHTNMDFCVVDALHLVEWWKSQGLDNKFHKPLVICTNNTINIMPKHIRGVVVNQMLALAGSDGLCMISYWNGNFSPTL